MTTDEEVDAAGERIALQWGGNAEGYAFDLVRLAVDNGVNAADAIAGLRLMALANAEVQGLEVALIEIARDCNVKWQQIAEALGLKTRQAAESRYQALSGRRPPKAGEPYTTLEELTRELIASEKSCDPSAVVEESIEVAMALGIKVRREGGTPLTATQARDIEAQVGASILTARTLRS